MVWISVSCATALNSSALTTVMRNCSSCLSSWCWGRNRRNIKEKESPGNMYEVFLMWPGHVLFLLTKSAFILSSLLLRPKKTQTCLSFCVLCSCTDWLLQQPDYCGFGGTAAQGHLLCSGWSLYERGQSHRRALPPGAEREAGQTRPLHQPQGRKCYS